MNYSCKIALGIAFAFGISMPMVAQEKVTPEDKVAVEDLYEKSFSDAIFAVLNLPSSDLAAEDGHYLAQNKLELQTYYDLKLSYQYMGEQYLRRHLGIAADEGIILTAAHESGEGFKNGFRGGDIVLKVDDKPVKTQYELVIALSKNRGKKRKATLLREGKTIDLSVVLSPNDQEQTKHWVIGVSVVEVSKLAKAQLKIVGGLAVSELTEAGAAQEAGILVHDIITHVDGKQINAMEELKQIVGASNGQKITFGLIRAGKKLLIEIEPKELAVANAANPLSSQKVLSGPGQLTIVPKLVGAEGDYLLTWQIGQPKTQDANSTDADQSKRIEAIEATLRLLQEQLQELKPTKDR